MKLFIELKSDLCVSDGSGYNSMIDNDVCYDTYGFPYIPAKRIKGCLRECALELADWGEDIKVDALFGSEGEAEHMSVIRIGNARLPEEELVIGYLKEHGANPVIHPQSILSHYTSLRKQTAVDYETGVADDKSLRTSRVINKGLKFETDIEIIKANAVDDDDWDEKKKKIKEQIEKCCLLLRHMGVARSRGMGEVRVTVQDDEGDGSTHGHGFETKKPNGGRYVSDKASLAYRITLLEPMVCKSVAGGEAKTEDYIAGSKMMGVIAGMLKEEKKTFEDFVGTDLVCTNAYLEYKEKRCTEVPGYLYDVKNHSDEYVNKLYEKETAEEAAQDKNGDIRQLNKMKHCYVLETDEGLVKSSVLMQERYHHRRPEDKSIGRASAKAGANADFYTIESLCEGQSFVGSILGNTKQLQKIWNYLSKNPIRYMGYGKSAEYGKVRIDVAEIETDKDSQEEKGVQKEEKNGREVLIELLSPAIVYSRKAIPSTKSVDLIEEVLVALGQTEASEKVANSLRVNARLYMKYTTLGGFNVTWNMRKPYIDTFDKGTAIVLKFDKELTVDEGLYMIGERNSEGYGECRISILQGDGKYDGTVIEADDGNLSSNLDLQPENINPEVRKVLLALCKDRFSSFIRLEAAIDAAAWYQKNKSESVKPTVSNMILMMKDSSTIEDIVNAVEKRFLEASSAGKDKKYEIATKILQRVSDGQGDGKDDNAKNLISDFCAKYHLTGFSPETENVRMEYLKEFLIQIKYAARTVKSEGKKEEGENDE